MRLSFILLAVTSLGIVLFPPGAAAEVGGGPPWEGYFRLGRILGEATEPNHLNWSVIKAFDEGLDVAVSQRPGGVGNVVFRPLQFIRTIDRSSPDCYSIAADGRRLDTGTLELVRRSSQGASSQVLKIDLTGVRISAIASDGSTGQTPAERISLAFEGLTINSVTITGRVRPQSIVFLQPSAPDPGEANAGFPGAYGVGVLPKAKPMTAGESPWLLRNLLQNPGAESGSQPTEAWVSEGGFDALAYDAFPAVAHGSGHGQNFFSMASAAESGVGTQVVDVSAVARAIDSRQLQAVLGGWLGGKSGEQDAARLVALFRDAAGAPLGSLQLDSGRSVEPDLARQERTGAVPIGTRAVEVSIQFHHSTAGIAVAYADDLSLVLEEVTSRSGKLPIHVQLLRTTGSFHRSQVQLSWAISARDVFIESADQLNGPWRAETAPTRVENDQTNFIVPTNGEEPARFWRVRTTSPLP